jgi:hypothetical protein
MDILPGQLAFLVVVATFDAAWLGWLTLRWYQRAVIRLMRRRPSEEAASELVEHAVPTASPTDGSFNAAPTAGTQRLRHDSQTGMARRVAFAYGAGAVLFSTVVSVALIAATGDTNPANVAAGMWIFAWPIVPSLGLLLAYDRRRTLLLAAAYLCIGAVVVAAVTIVSQALSGAIDAAPLANVYRAIARLFNTISVSVVLVAITGWRRARLVMPLALATALIFGAALLITPRLVTPAFDVAPIRDAMLRLPTLASGVAIYYALVLLVALPLGWIAWRLLNALAAAYGAKRFSDVQLVVDCWWVIIAADAAAWHLVTPFGIGGVALGAAAFAAYRGGVAAVLRTTGDGKRNGVSRLLLLRVFGYQARTERFFDGIGQRWRLRGPVHLIGAADLATRTTDPGDVLAFVDGRLDEQFVTRPADIARRLASLDTQADPDGRFRANEIYCHDAVWRETLVQLLGLTDLVVMDLRRFGRENRGCIFEIDQLFARLPPERIVLICDATTDRQLLREVVAGAPPHGLAHPAADRAESSIVSVERNSLAELEVVMQRLVRATSA